MNRTLENPIKSSAKFRLPTAILGGDISADGSTIYAGCMDGIYEFDLNKKKSVKVDSHDSYVSSVIVDDDRKQIISAGYDGRIHWFDTSAKKRIRKVDAHQFWSWQMVSSPDGKWIASVTGQYLAGDYDYKPAQETEPCIKVFDAETGEERHRFSHVPSVQAVAISPDSKYVVAGNLMGEIRVYSLEANKQVAAWTTSDFTSWGIIKSHCYIGGIYDMQFSPDGEHVYAAGMGFMRDPMAGNGRQLWQKFSWKDKPPKKVDETHKGESGEGLMESFTIHPNGKYFVMAGRLRGGSWNAALFEIATGKLVQSLKTGYRITQAIFSRDGKKLYLCGGQGQPKNKKAKSPDFGRIDSFDINLE